MNKLLSAGRSSLMSRAARHVSLAGRGKLHPTACSSAMPLLDIALVLSE